VPVCLHWRGVDALELQSLTRRFGALVALDALSLTVPAGTMFGLLRPNGAGKTTAMRIVPGILAPDAGGGPFRGVGVGVWGTYAGREDGIGCRNPEFHELPRERASFRVFAVVAD